MLSSRSNSPRPKDRRANLDVTACFEQIVLPFLGQCVFLPVGHALYELQGLEILDVTSGREVKEVRRCGGSRIAR